MNTELDKVLHSSVGLIVLFATAFFLKSKFDTSVLVSLLIAYGVVIIAGFAKELLDVKVGKEFDIQDVYATINPFVLIKYLFFENLKL